ncbi:PREDICTED: tectonin beta-propeller repeat-containing protein 1 [Elephantulus edwardii]|uniref:tectonin beta-propeller repeat-containing protein 1 n=1 Tax=Elephantulus edwardii TaxID=28737 RepID=UPI0003F08066|nr:PREDICTED: tectonin beta-propeller repeat-containing protein 1 [Elephantulus edwardii]
MSASMLWAVDLFGRVYTLSTAGQHWAPCQDTQLEFRRISAARECCWGIAADNQVYVYVCSSDVPIRHREEAYENQRWNPMGGFCVKLLPSDRWQWSDVTGLQHRPLDGVALPSPHWEWEAAWYVDENFAGEPTEKEGWTYAIDFPATYTKDKKWNSCVRRRKWIRYRRYKSQDVWAKIPLEDDPKELPDPFNDLSVGGWEVTDEPVGRLSVWVVSLQGKVWYRENVSHSNPEGSSWSLVDTPEDVVQISCGPCDLLWATVSEGKALVREGISRHNPKGSSWSIVEAPVTENGITHISVGASVVWAVTKDRKVWFRRGVSSHSPCGTSWIEMVGEMVMVNVGLNDQVWGIAVKDREMYFRQGITPSELSGKTWKAIVAGRECDQSHSGGSSSVLNAGCFFGDEVRGSSEYCAPNDASTPADSPDNPGNDKDQPAAKAEGQDNTAKEPGGDPQPNPDSPPAVLPWTTIDLKEPRQAPGLLEPAVGLLPLGLEEPYRDDDQLRWAWVSGGGCAVEAHMALKWFSAPSGLAPVQTLGPPVTLAQVTAWRKKILSQLTERTRRELENFRHYEQAVEQSVWVKTGALQWWCDWKPHKWVDVRVVLEQFTGNDGAQDSILFIYYMVQEEKKYLHIFLNEVTVVVPILYEAKHSFALYTPERTQQRWPVRLAAPTEQEMNDWLALLSLSCCESRRLRGCPSPQAIWSVTCKGDIFVSEPSHNLEAPERALALPCDQMFWRQIGGHLRMVEASGHGVVWGLGYDHKAWVYTGGYGGGYLQGVDSSTNVYPQSDIKCISIYENQRWNPIAGYTSRGLPTDRYMWSDASGLQERTKACTKPPSPQWTWVSEWYVDFSVPGGTDPDGWQYATDFPFSYRGNKTKKDFVRRRCWTRKCKLVTSGPWLEVSSTTLKDVSIIPKSPGAEGSIALWAISDTGDVLCRLGVSELNPAGLSWQHVSTNQPFICISVGACYQVWAVAHDGSAFYRGSVSPSQPAGDSWYHVPSPRKQHLKQVSVGYTSVFALDENGNLWYRQGIVPSYPQGSSWEHVSNNVHQVSVGPLDQVWVIANKVQGSHSLSRGTVCHRTGVQPREPSGLGWDFGIGGDWNHISVRANDIRAPRSTTPLETDMTPQEVTGLGGGGMGPLPRALRDLVSSMCLGESRTQDDVGPWGQENSSGKWPSVPETWSHEGRKSPPWAQAGGAMLGCRGA